MLAHGDCLYEEVTMDGVNTNPPSDAFVAELTRCLPHMRSFARFLCRGNDLADDLVQDAVVRALVAAHQFQPGTNFKAWIFTIMHNQTISNYRRKRPVVTSTEVVEPASCQIAPNQIDALILRDLDRAIRRIPAAQRNALILVVVHGLSYDDAARVCHCAVGTIKSRVGRARAALHEMLLGQHEAATPRADQRPALNASSNLGFDGQDEHPASRIPGSKRSLAIEAPHPRAGPRA
ncbi:MAG: sigma-70 family RNA polymerase sigma factor [Defluviicoccus sp.]